MLRVWLKVLLIFFLKIFYIYVKKRKKRKNEKKIEILYPDVILSFNNYHSDIHLICLNYYGEEELDILLKTINKQDALFYYQNQKHHTTNEEKDKELQKQLNLYCNVIGKHIGYSWWKYIRHFIIKN